ncbi:MAG: transglycosylase SLT domain-containing protein, partial [Desulfopila sp.]|nr:transglycosylase SLT domain-containing protein [Desulfopila sp.]
MTTICKVHYKILLFALLFSFCNSPSVYCREYKNYFPSFQIIRNNVVFWEKIFSEISENTAVLHDREDLSIIYETVPLLDSKLPGAQQINTKRLESIRKKYISTLTKLGTGAPPSTAAEKRISAMFSPPQITTKFLNAAQGIRIQTGLKERFMDGVIQSGAYMKEMKKIFRSYNLPEDLVYIPHVESSFNIHANSKYGAVGAWQFTRGTGMEYMTINSLIDERRDLLLATDAAARYLKRNLENLGTWPLAITAYNYGHAGMKRALQQEGTYENIFRNYRQGHFKFASRNFYSEFLAARNVAKKLEQIPSIKRAVAFQRFSVGLPGYAHIDDITEHFQITRDDLRKLNPSLLPPIWQGERYLPRGFLLQLPYSQKIVRLANTIPSDIFKDQQKQSLFYKVKKGDTAGGIAQQFGITLKDLSKANNLKSNALVYIGQNLRIPESAPRAKRAKTSARQPPTKTIAAKT